LTVAIRELGADVPELEAKVTADQLRASPGTTYSGALVWYNDLFPSASRSLL